MKRAMGGERKFVLYEDRIETPEGPQPLTPDLVASVDTAGNIAQSVKSRSTLTRMGAGTLVAGPIGLLVGATAKKTKTQTRDTRELYLLIDGGTWMSSAACNPDQGAQVRQFAQQVTVAARNVEQAREIGSSR